MLVAAACCPCPPLLVPEVASGAAGELEALRAACMDAVGVLAAARPDVLVVVGPADQAGRGPYPQGAGGSFRGFGVDLAVRLGQADDTEPEPAERELPPSLAVGAWLLERAEWNGTPVRGLGVGEPLAPERCAETGREIAAGARRVALLVLGDGSARRSQKAPGYYDERAAGFDAEAARALGDADTAALAALDAEPAAALQATGRACWQVAAGAAENAELSGALLYNEAPYGVGYFVATWS
ncbi:class III extradiol dioxygenase subunit B-like domain-containing protein [Streptomyces sp. WMMC500]|uniref:class III extradiol dioxygenase subunit B-like domain-containing protein n=1 Tax=Streptomyces sp. WMMC500 TaxID=3015154 RepID=UPI00248BCE2A|nr:class III extradiol dioxygenase subunit B-like domain-containing protein [Streptomyces sp. WMMC500]WBB62664.1 class III extradiol dioxygenase subunit B-like domain-containing protein [Streptomyces sp. WMMC500]